MPNALLLEGLELWGAFCEFWSELSSSAMEIIKMKTWCDGDKEVIGASLNLSENGVKNVKASLKFLKWNKRGEKYMISFYWSN